MLAAWFTFLTLILIMFGVEALQEVDLCTSALAVLYSVCTCMVQGLEGRSNNPVSLLMDTLNHPCADLGLELPSLLEWHRHPECQVDHIVLGKGPPGGSWQVILSSWSDLQQSISLVLIECLLTFWRRNYFFNFNTHTVYKM